MAQVSSVVSAVTGAAKIVLDKVSLEIKLENLEKDIEFISISGNSITSGVMSVALAVIRGAELPTVAKYAEIYGRYNQLMANFRGVVERDIDTIRKVSGKIEQADHHS